MSPVPGDRTESTVLRARFSHSPRVAGLTRIIRWAGLVYLMGLLLQGAGPVVPAPMVPADLHREFSIRNWGKESGLPDNRVKVLFQTHDGYLWMGTPYGLVRFDGITFTQFTRGTRADMGSDHCLSLGEDTAGNLWIGTTGGVLRWDGERFTRATRQEGLYHDEVTAIATMRDGSVWVGMSSVVQRFPAGNFRPGPPQNIGGSNVSLCRGSEDDLWLGNDSLWRLDPLKLKIESSGRPSRTGADVIIRLVSTPDSGLLALAKGPADEVHFATFREGRWGDTHVSPTSNQGRAEWLIHGHLNQLWLPDGSRGLVRFSDGRFEPAGVPWTAAEDFAICGLEDREGNLWIGTESSGLFCLSRKRLTTVGRTDGLPHDNARSLWPATGGGVWAATDAGLSRVASNLQSVTNWTEVEGRPLENLKAVAETAGGGVRLGLSLEQFTLANGHFTRQRFSRPAGDRSLDANDTGFNKVRCFFPSRDGSLWVAVPRGLHRLRGDEDRWFTTKDGLGADDVRALLETRAGVLWAGTAGGGLSRFTRDPVHPFTTLTRNDGLSRDTVWALCEDPDGVVWAGTDGGLNRVEENRIAAFDTRHGLPADGVNSVIDDDLGHLWIGHDRGLYFVDRAELKAVANGRASRVHCVPFGIADGMAVAECNGQTATPAAYKTADGRLWFGTPKGIVVVDPKSIRENSAAPPVVIESVKADEEIVHGEDTDPRGLGKRVEGRALRLPPGRARFLEFSYTANTFIGSENARFRYRLEGYEEMWHDAGTRRLAHYIGLAPGTYCFHVIAANHDDVWNETGAVFPFSLAPYYYQTRWFWGGVGVVSMGCLGILGRWRLNTVRRTAGDAERARLARALHDHLGADLTSLQSLAELARREIPPGHPASAHVQRLSAATTDAGRTLRDAIFTLGPGDSTLAGLCARITQFAGDLLSPAGVRCRFDWPLPLPEIRLHPEAAFELYLGVKEALANVLKHARAQTCTLALEITATDISLTITDDGRGFDPTGGEPVDGSPEGWPGGRGLKNLQAHAVTLGGTCEVRTQPGRGVTVQFNLKRETMEDRR